MITVLAIIIALFIGINALLGLVLWTIASVKEYRNGKMRVSTATVSTKLKEAGMNITAVVDA